MTKPPSNWRLFGHPKEETEATDYDPEFSKTAARFNHRPSCPLPLHLPNSPQDENPPPLPTHATTRLLSIIPPQLHDPPSPTSKLPPSPPPPALPYPPPNITATTTTSPFKTSLLTPNNPGKACTTCTIKRTPADTGTTEAERLFLLLHSFSLSLSEVTLQMNAHSQTSPSP